MSGIIRRETEVLEELMQNEFFNQPKEPTLEPNSNAYVYKPIVGDGVIRLLHLKPGKGLEPLNGSLEHVLIAKNSGYEAVSYTWGPSEKPESISLDNGVMDVTLSV
jgi:hypothetical protein